MSRKGFPGDSVVKNLPGCRRRQRHKFNRWVLGRSLGEGNDNPLQYSCLGNPKDRGASWATVRGFQKNTTAKVLHFFPPSIKKGFIMQRWLSVKYLPVNAGDTRSAGSIPGGGNGNPLQYSCLEDSMDRGAWRDTVHGVTKTWT